MCSVFGRTLSKDTSLYMGTASPSVSALLGVEKGPFPIFHSFIHSFNLDSFIPSTFFLGPMKNQELF